MTRRSIAAVGALAAAAMIAVSCSTTTPKIAETFWQVNLVRHPSQSGVEERLSFFVHVTDSEGISDLGSIYLLSDSSELYWHLDPSNWQSSDANGELWVGSNRIEMPDRSHFPRGKYRVILSNLAGERATSDIFLSAERLEPPHIPFPRLTIDANLIHVESSLPQTSVWLYNAGGELVGSRRTGQTVVPITSLLPRSNLPSLIGNLYAYAYDQSCGCGLLEGPYAVDYHR